MVKQADLPFIYMQIFLLQLPSTAIIVADLSNHEGLSWEGGFCTLGKC